MPTTTENLDKFLRRGPRNPHMPLVDPWQSRGRGGVRDYVDPAEGSRGRRRGTEGRDIDCDLDRISARALRQLLAGHTRVTAEDAILVTDKLASNAISPRRGSTPLPPVVVQAAPRPPHRGRRQRSRTTTDSHPGQGRWAWASAGGPLGTQMGRATPLPAQDCLGRAGSRRPVRRQQRDGSLISSSRCWEIDLNSAPNLHAALTATLPEAGDGGCIAGLTEVTFLSSPGLTALLSALPGN